MTGRKEMRVTRSAGIQREERRRAEKQKTGTLKPVVQRSTPHEILARTDDRGLNRESGW